MELPAEHDGKHIDIHFVKEGNLDEATQTPSFKPEVSNGFSFENWGCLTLHENNYKWPHCMKKVEILTTGRTKMFLERGMDGGLVNLGDQTPGQIWGGAISTLKCIHCSYLRF